MSTRKLALPPTLDDLPSSVGNITSYCGRRVRLTDWGNLDGYIGRRKVAEFGPRTAAACEWLKDAYKPPVGYTNPDRILAAENARHALKIPQVSGGQGTSYPGTRVSLSQRFHADLGRL